MRVLGIETSCDETGIAVYDTTQGLLAHRLHSQVALHALYGGVVPELASRDHVRRIVPLIQETLAAAGLTVADLDGIAYTAGPGLGGALLVGASVASGLAVALQRPVVAVHHLEGHLLSPLLADPRPAFPFTALLVSGGHTQLMAVRAVGEYQLLGEAVDDAAGEAFDKSAKLLGLPYPGGALLSQLAEQGDPARFTLPRPMLHSGNLDFSFSGLKTAVLTLVRQQLRAADGAPPDKKHEADGNLPLDGARLDQTTRADIAAAFQDAVSEVLVAKCRAALRQTGSQTLVVGGGVGANRQLRERLSQMAARHRYQVYYPPLEFCTDNGAMIALAGALRLQAGQGALAGPFAVRPRWDLATLPGLT